MDYEALKDQWSEVEDRDGIRLSWNTFPSSRMVNLAFPFILIDAHGVQGSFPAGGAHWSPLHAFKREA